MSIRERNANTFSSLGFPKVFEDMARGERVLTPFLTNLINQPFEFYTFVEHYPGSLPFEDSLLPLWEDNGDVLYAYVDDGSSRFIEFGYEWQKEDFTVLAHDYQSFLVDRFAEFYLHRMSPRDGSIAPDSLSAEIALFDFKRDEELRAAIKKFTHSISSVFHFEPEDVAASIITQ